jgi:hypothetical protein
MSYGTHSGLSRGDPWRQSADAIAMRLGIEKTAMIRLRAGVSYALTEAMDEGHCGLPTDQLIPLAEELFEAPRELILTALELERSDGAVIADKVGDTACMFLAGLYRAEQVIAEQLIRIVSGKLPWAWIDEEKALPWVEKRSCLQLADSQRAAIRLALTAKALVIRIQRPLTIGLLCRRLTSFRQVECLKRANIGRRRTVRRTGQIDPERISETPRLEVHKVQTRPFSNSS